MKGGSYVPDADWVGTNSVFFGSNGGGNGWARKQKSKVHRQQNVMKAKTQARPALSRGLAALVGAVEGHEGLWPRGCWGSGSCGS